MSTNELPELVNRLQTEVTPDLWSNVTPERFCAVCGCWDWSKETVQATAVVEQYDTLCEYRRCDGTIEYEYTQLSYEGR